MGFTSIFLTAWAVAADTAKAAVAILSKDTVDTINNVEKKIDKTVIPKVQKAKSYGSAELKKVYANGKQRVSDVQNFIKTKCPLLHNNSVKLNGDLSFSLGPQISLEGAILGAHVGGTVNGGSVKLFGLNGSVHLFSQEGLQQEGEISYAGKNNSYEVEQELAGSVPYVGGGVKQSGKFEHGILTEHSVAVTTGPVEFERKDATTENVDSASSDIVSIHPAIFLGLNIQISVSFDHKETK